MTQNEMHDLTTRTERLVNAISGSILSTVEVAAERIALAAEVARVAQRMNAFSAILEAVGAQKDDLAVRLANAKGPMRALIRRQIELLSSQEAAILEKAGAPPEAVRVAIETTDAPLYQRKGKRFERLDSRPAAMSDEVEGDNHPESTGTSNGRTTPTAQ